jgi:glycosyltransferase involved in cell wall biosynthesis
MANQTRQLAALLASEGIAVDVVQTNAPYRPAWVAGLPIVRAAFRLLPYVVALRRACRRADLVHVMANSGWSWHLFAAPAVWIAAACRVPVVVNYRGGEAAAFFARRFHLVRPTLARARSIVVPSTFLREVFARFGFAAVEVPNIVDLEAFHAPHATPANPRILVTRNLEAVYDIATALRAFALVQARVPAAGMTIAGSGPQRAELEGIATALGVAPRVRFTGRLDNAELPALYREATVALNPSLADNMPISLLEAMASGVPIVSTNVGGIPYVVRDGYSALLVPPGDANRMAEAVLRVIEDASLARQLAANGAREAIQYQWPRVRPRLLAVYARAMDAASESPRVDDPARVRSPEERP